MFMRSAGWALATALMAGVGAAAQEAAAPSEAMITPVTDAELASPDPAEWLMWRRTLDSTGFSPLDQIARDNVDQLQLVWTRGLAEGDQEGTPLVRNGVMYFLGPNNVLEAYHAATGDLIWTYRRQLPDDLGDYLPAVGANRNIAIRGDRLFVSTFDDYLIALDAATGELVWETMIDDYQTGSKQSSGPIVGGGRIYSSRGCEPEGGPDACVITAHDPDTGEELWRRRTIPRPGEPGDESWGGVPDEQRIHVGAWMVPSYDPELDMVYVGTSVTAPAPKYQLAGNELQYLHHNSTLALNGETGEIVWAYQHLVDHWDLDHTFERILVDTEVAPDADAVAWINPNLTPGEERRVITGVPGKTGIVYTLDRATGEFLWARPTIFQNVIADIDGATGAVIPDPGSIFEEHGQQLHVCPSAQGGKNWPAGAYSPLTGALYMPMQNTCANVTSIPAGESVFAVYGLAGRDEVGPDTDNMGTLYAVSAVTGETLWTREQRAGMLSLITTGGGLVFSGDANGRFRALDDATGEVLWEVNLGSAVTGYPATFSVDGRQFVAVSTGIYRSGGLTPELRLSGANNLFVFALPAP